MRKQLKGPYSVYGQMDSGGGDEILIVHQTDIELDSPQFHVYRTYRFDYGSGIEYVRTYDDTNAGKMFAILDSYNEYDFDKAIEEILKL